MSTNTIIIIAAVVIFLFWGCGGPKLAQNFGGSWNQAGYYGRY